MAARAGQPAPPAHDHEQGVPAWTKATRPWNRLTPVPPPPSISTPICTPPPPPPTHPQKAQPVVRRQELVNAVKQPPPRRHPLAPSGGRRRLGARRALHRHPTTHALPGRRCQRHVDRLVGVGERAGAGGDGAPGRGERERVLRAGGGVVGDRVGENNLKRRRGGGEEEEEGGRDCHCGGSSDGGSRSSGEARPAAPVAGPAPCQRHGHCSRRQPTSTGKRTSEKGDR